MGASEALGIFETGMGSVTAIVLGLLLLVGLYSMGIGTREQLAIDGTAIGILLVTLFLAVEFDWPYSGNMKLQPTAFEKALVWAMEPDR